MDWIDINKQKPTLNSEVLIFCQGYDITGTHYWNHYELGTYIIHPYDKRRKLFVQGISINREKDGSIYGSPWVYRGVTHWMPLPSPPSKIDSEKYMKLAGYDKR